MVGVVQQARFLLRINMAGSLAVTGRRFQFLSTQQAARCMLTRTLAIKSLCGARENRPCLSAAEIRLAGFPTRIVCRLLSGSLETGRLSAEELLSGKLVSEEFSTGIFFVQPASRAAAITAAKMRIVFAIYNTKFPSTAWKRKTAAFISTLPTPQSRWQGLAPARKQPA